MAVYVDNARRRYGTMLMCHCWADTLAELMAMMDRIGVKRKWLQQPPAAKWVHFDIASSKRLLAIQFGAIATDRYGPVAHVATLAGDTDKLEMVARCRLLKSKGNEPKWPLTLDP